MTDKQIVFNETEVMLAQMGFTIVTGGCQQAMGRIFCDR